MCVLHKFKDVETQITKGICFGFAVAELPGMRVIQICSKCGKTKYINLNLSMPNKYLHVENIWRKKYEYNHEACF